LHKETATMSVPRVALKNQMTLYKMCPSAPPDYGVLRERVGKLPYEQLVQDIAAVLDAHVGDIPVEAVRELGLHLSERSFRQTRRPVPEDADVPKTPLGIMAAKLGLLYAAEVFFGAAHSLDLLADRYDEEQAEEQDIEELMKPEEDE
jgi:hypothetical protein